MKVRYGFVSNSSTTSFCVYGYAVDPRDDKFMKDEETLKRWFVKLFPKEEMDEDFDKLTEQFRELMKYNLPNAEAGNSNWDENIYVGRVMGSGGDPMNTDKVLAEVRAMYEIPEDEKPGWHEDAWRDG